MAVTWWERAAEQFEPRKAPQWSTPGEMAVALDPRTKQIPALRLIDEALVWAFNTPDARLLIQAPPQSGKSQRTSRRFPLWALTQNPDLRITIASYETGVARRWGRAIRDDIATHGKDLGLKVRDDVSAQGEWILQGHEGGVFTAGIGSALTGRPSDMMLVDDPVKNTAEADSLVYRDRAWDWWVETAMTRLAPGAPAIIIMTRWSHDDLGGRVLRAEGGDQWRVVNISAQADHRPELGETDILGREPGEFMENARGMTTAQWERRKRDSGPRTWAALYQGRPSPETGGILPSKWERYDQPMWTERADGARIIPGMERADQELAASWDLTFSDTKGSDFVVGQMWLRVGIKAYLVDQVRARMNFNATCEAMLAMQARWPQCRQVFTENKANGPAVINALSQKIQGLIPIEPEGSKTARASAVSPLAFAGDIILPTAEILPGVEDFLEEARSFPTSAHDDTVDAMSQAINRLLLMPIGSGLLDVVEPDEYEAYAETSYMGAY